MTKPSDAYKPTFLDRHGSEGAQYIAARLWGVSIGLLTFLFLVGRQGLTLKSVGGGVLAGILVASLGQALGSVFESVWSAIAVNGGIAPSPRSYSYEKSLVMQGKVEEALLSIESVISGDPTSIPARLFGAELYFREGKNAARSAELLREAHAIRPISAGDDIFIANRLVDLYTGPLETPDKAIRELRRVIEKYGDTAAGDHARLALATLKERYPARLA